MIAIFPNRVALGFSLGTDPWFGFWSSTTVEANTIPAMFGDVNGNSFGNNPFIAGKVRCVRRE